MMNPPSQTFDHRARYVADMLRTLARSKGDLLARANLTEAERFTLNRLAGVVTNREIPSARDYRLLMALAAKLPQSPEAGSESPPSAYLPASKPRPRESRSGKAYPPDDGTSWGDKVKELRQTQRMSRRRLAEMAGVPDRTIRYIETGETRPTLDQLRRLFEAMERQPDGSARA